MYHFHILNNELANTLKALKPFQSTEEARYYLSGVYLHIFEGELHGVATDGHTLCRTKILSEPAEDNETNENPLEFILPSVAVDHLIKLAKDRKGGACLVDIDETAIFDFGDFKYETKPVDGSYPDYMRVIPDRTEPSSHGVQAEYLKKAIAALGGKTIDIETPSDPYAARILSSSDAEGVLCLIMPKRV